MSSDTRNATGTIQERNQKEERKGNREVPQVKRARRPQWIEEESKTRRKKRGRRVTFGLFVVNFLNVTECNNLSVVA